MSEALHKPRWQHLLPASFPEILLLGGSHALIGQPAEDAAATSDARHLDWDAAITALHALEADLRDWNENPRPFA